MPSICLWVDEPVAKPHGSQGVAVGEPFVIAQHKPKRKPVGQSEREPKQQPEREPFNKSKREPFDEPVFQPVFEPVYLALRGGLQRQRKKRRRD